jgi:hypothetical protein
MMGFSPGRVSLWTFVPFAVSHLRLADSLFQGRSSGADDRLMCFWVAQRFSAANNNKK